MTTFDINRCCDPEKSQRYALQQPWVHQGWRYATDGRIAVRVPADGEPNTEATGSQRFPRVFTLFEGIQKSPDFTRCTEPLGELTGEQDCSLCEGSGKRLANCANCEGTGKHHCNECGQDHDCGKCLSKGRVPGTEECRACQGGCLTPADNTEIGDQLFSGWLLRILQDVLGLRVQAKEKDDGGPLAFIGDGGLQGLVMPRKKVRKE